MTCATRRAQNHHHIGTTDHFEHVLENLDDYALKNLLEAATTTDRKIPGWVELQVHGAIDLEKDAIAVVATARHRGTPVEEQLRALASRHGLELRFDDQSS
jgi:hypothetical protein